MSLHVTFDTTFFVTHFYAKNSDFTKTREILRRSIVQGSRGVVPTIVLAELYTQVAKRTGASEAERRLNEICSYGLEIASLSMSISRRAGMLRHKYEEKIPWGDCLVAATAIEAKSDYVITEDPEFKSIKEIKCKNVQSVNI